MLQPITVRYSSGPPAGRWPPGRSPTCSASPRRAATHRRRERGARHPPRRPRAVHRARGAASRRCSGRADNWAPSMLRAGTARRAAGRCPARHGEDRLATLAACGLSEARLLLRTPGEFSEGQRYRFRLAYALAAGSPLMPPTSSPRRSTARWPRWSRSTCGSSPRARRRRAGRDHARGHRRRPAAGRAGALRARADRSRAPGEEKRPGVVRGRALALGRHPSRLAALRSVALPQPPPRLRPPRDPAVAREPVGVCVFGTPAASLSLRPILRAARPASGVASRRSTSNCGCCSASCFTRRIAGPVSPPNSFARRASVPGAVDRDADSDGAGQPVLRARRVYVVGVIRKRGGRRIPSVHGAYGSKVRACRPRQSPRAALATRCITCSTTGRSGDGFPHATQSVWFPHPVRRPSCRRRSSTCRCMSSWCCSPSSPCR